MTSSSNGDSTGREPDPSSWGAINQVAPAASELSRTDREARTHGSERTGDTGSDPTPSFELPPGAPRDPGTIDMRPGSYRTYSAPLTFLAIAVVASGVGYLVLKEDKVDPSKRPQIHFSGSTLQQAGQVPDNIKAPPPPKRRLVRFDSKPAGARVLINDQLADGLTPMEASVAEGPPTGIRILHDGYERLETQLSPGQTQLVVELNPLDPKSKRVMKPSRLDITTTPAGAEVSIDGLSLGTTPLEGATYAWQGDVSIVLRKEGYYSHTVLTRLTPDKPQSIGARLSPKASGRSGVQMNIESDPHGATIERVSASGQTKRLGRTGYSPLLHAGRVGDTVILRGSLAGHTPTERQFDLTMMDYTVKLHLDIPAPSFGAITLSGPRNVSVYLNSDELDGLPLKNYRLKTGTHRLTVVDKKTRKRVVHTFELTADQSLDLALKVTADGPIIQGTTAR